MRLRRLSGSLLLASQDLYFFTLSEFYPQDYAIFNWCGLSMFQLA